MRVFLLTLSFLTIALLFTSCGGTNRFISAGQAEPKAPTVSERANLSSDVDIQKLQKDLIDLESRVSALEDVTVGGKWKPLSGLPYSLVDKASDLESRLSSLEEVVTGEGEFKVAWGSPTSLEDRVSSLEQLIKSKPWEVREYSSFATTSLEDRVSRIERELGIGSFWNP